MATADASIVGVATAILIFLPGVFLNGMFLFMYGRRRRLQIPAIYFLVSLCVCNFIMEFFWMITTMIAQFGYTTHLDQAAPQNGYCQFQGVLLTFYQTLHMHTYCLLALERVLKFYKPSLHTEVFYNDIVVIMALVVMWLLELVPALFHVMTWGSIVYMTDQYQCAYDDTVAHSRLNAMFMYTYIIPFLFTLICFICVFVKYFILKSKAGVSPDFHDDTIIEEDLTSGQKSFSSGKKSGKFDGLDDSDEEEGYNSLFAIYGEDDDKDLRSEVYKYRTREIEFALLIFFIWLLFLILWIMYMIVVYMKAYDPTIVTTPTAMPLGLETAMTFLSHSTLSLCPCLYWIVNRRFRRHIRMACNCQDKPKEPKPQKVYPQPSYQEPVYRRGAGGPQVKNIHRGSLGEFS